jgi:hypothetical protein
MTVLIAIDPGATSGWALFEGNDLVASGVAKSLGDRQAVMERLSDHAADITAVLEDWTAGGWKAVSQLLGMGSARGRWLEQLETIGIRGSRVHGVYPQTWRTVLAPLKRKTNEEAKASARTVARAHLGRDVGPDEAEAVCIGLHHLSAARLASAVKAAERVKRVASRAAARRAL